MTDLNETTTKRRGFLRTLSGAATLGATGVALSDRAQAASQAQGCFESDPFTLGTPTA